jgi:hypothetical protein
MMRLNLLLLLGACLCARGVRADVELASRLEQARAELTHVEAMHAERARLCHQKLHVNACRLEVQAARNEATRPIKERLYELEAAVRTQRAQAKREDIRQRQALHDSRLQTDSFPASTPATESPSPVSRQP